MLKEPKEKLSASALVDVLITGTQLGPLMSQLCGRRVSRLKEPARAEKFSTGAGTQITGIAVQKAE